MPLHSQEMSLVLSSDAKPRLKWTPELHQRFIDAVNQLGGGESEYKHFCSSPCLRVCVCVYYILTNENLCFECRGYTEIVDEGYGHSWTHFVPPQEPFTGNHFVVLFVLIIIFLLLGNLFLNGVIVFHDAEI